MSTTYIFKDFSEASEQQDSFTHILIKEFTHILYKVAMASYRGTMETCRGRIPRQRHSILAGQEHRRIKVWF